MAKPEAFALVDSRGIRFLSRACLKVISVGSLMPLLFLQPVTATSHLLKRKRLGFRCHFPESNHGEVNHNVLCTTFI